MVEAESERWVLWLVSIQRFLLIFGETALLEGMWHAPLACFTFPGSDSDRVRPPELLTFP